MDYTDNETAAQRLKINARTIAISALKKYDDDRISEAAYGSALQTACHSLELARAIEEGEI